MKRFNAKVTLMPDIFIDHFIVLGDLEDIIEKLYKVASRGGGNLIASQWIGRGGNAANTAAALSRLGVKVNLIISAGPLTLKLIDQLLDSHLINIIVKPRAEDNITAILELKGANIMLSYPGALDLGPEMLSSGDWEILRRSEIVGVFNWNMNKRSNELLESLVDRRVKKVYLDTGDPSVASYTKARRLVEILSSHRIFALSVNEWEVRFLARMLTGENLDPISSAEKVFKSLNLEHLDLHTVKYSYSLPEAVKIPVQVVEPKVLTGAGDAWNAGNIYGYLKNMSVHERLSLANTVARCYVANGRHCGYDEVQRISNSQGTL